MGLATVMTDLAPLYEKPSPDARRLDEALYGMSVQVMQELAGGWCYLRTEHNTEGYSPAAALERDADIAAAWRKYQKVTVLAPYVDVLALAAPNASIVASLPRGGILVALGKPGIDGWQKVGLTGGAVGYTRASYLGEVISNWSALAEDDLRWNLVETALSYNGAAFRVGGRTQLGIDSVGLAAMSYLMNGLIIPQEPFLRPGGALHEIEYNKMEEGDLLYFHGSVGLYIGEDKFVHATDFVGNEGVLVNSLNPKSEAYRGDLAGHVVAVGSVF